MAKSQFRTDRLYKIAKMVVIIIAVLSLLKLFNDVYWLGDVTTYRNTTALEHDYDKCDMQTADIAKRNSCYTIAQDKQAVYPADRINQDLLFAFGLPVLFFGGTWLYNYLLPPKKTDSRK